MKKLKKIKETLITGFQKERWNNIDIAISKLDKYISKKKEKLETTDMPLVNITSTYMSNLSIIDLITLSDYVFKLANITGESKHKQLYINSKKVLDSRIDQLCEKIL